jgi:hypothetical protein
MKISNILEGIRMGASDLRKAAKKEYTIGFEFEVEVTDNYPMTDLDIDAYNDIDQPDDNEEMENFLNTWNGFDFSHWFNLNSHIDIREFIDEHTLIPRYNRPTYEQVVNFLRKQNKEYRASLISEYSTEQISFGKKAVAYLQQDKFDMRQHENSVAKIIAFYAVDLKEQNVTKSKVIDMIHRQFATGNDEFVKAQLSIALEFMDRRFSDSDIDTDDIEDADYIFADKQEEKIINIEYDVDDLEDLIKYYNTSSDVIRGLTQDQWSDTYTEDGIQAFQQWQAQYGSNSGNITDRLLYINSVISKHFGKTYTRANKHGWAVVPDGSVSAGGEIISPVMSLDDGISNMHKVFKIINETPYLKTTSKTGLHINIGTWNGNEYKNLDLFKFLIAFNGEYALKQFNRQHETYAKDALPKFIRAIQNSDLSEYDKWLDGLNSTVLDKATKHQAVNLIKLPSQGYIEIRAPGGENYERMGNEAEAQIRRAVRALDLAANPMAARQPYLAALSKLMVNTPTTIDQPASKHPIDVFFDGLGAETRNFWPGIFIIVRDGARISTDQLDKNYTIEFHKILMREIQHIPDLQQTLNALLVRMRALDESSQHNLLNSRLFKVLMRHHKGNPNENK